MEISPDKIKKLIDLYGMIHDYPKKSYVVFFCGDNDLNYNQWNNYLRGKQAIGMKVISDLMMIFPDLNMNWLFKDEGFVFNVKLVNTVDSTD